MKFSEMITHRTAAVSSLWNLSDVANPLQVLSDKLTNKAFKSYQVFHDDDLDGYTSALIMKVYLNAMHRDTPLNLIPVSHGQHFDHQLTPSALSAIQPDDLVIVLDQGLTLERYQKFMSTTAHILWIDHHSAHIGDNPEVEDSPLFDFIHSQDSSAMTTSSVIRRFLPKGDMVFNMTGSILPSRLIAVVDAYDTYRFHLLAGVTIRRKATQTFEDFPIGLNGLYRDGQREMIYDFFMAYREYACDVIDEKFELSSNEAHRLVEKYGSVVELYFHLESKALDAYEQIVRVAQAVADDHSTRFSLTVDPVAEGETDATVFTVAMAESSTYPDQVAAALMKKHEGAIDYVLIHFMKNNLHRISVRGDSLDCSALAKRFGGGGRERTAGISLDHEAYIEFLKKLKVITD